MVVAGPVNGATLTAYALQANGSNGASMGSATTGADGTFSLKLSSTPSGGVRLAAGGGSYTSEANVATVVSGTSLSAILPAVAADASGLVVSPLTTFADQRATALLAAGTAAPAAIATAEGAVKIVYGIQGAAALSALAPDFQAASGDAATAALIFGTLEQLAVTVGKPPSQVTDAIAQDLSDGVLDGKAAGGAAIKYASGDATAAPGNLASNQFLNAITAYTSPANTGTQAAKNGVAYSAQTVTALRGGVVAAAAQSSGLDISSSGAITSVTHVDTAGASHQTVYFAARTAGLKAIDFTNPSAPAAINLATLNAALTPLLRSIDGVIAVPVGSGDPQVLLYSFASATVVLVDAVTNTLVTSKALTIPSSMSCSGAQAFISGGVADTVGAAPLVWLTTGIGYLPVSIANGAIAAQTPVGAANRVGMAENVGASVVDRILFAPGYCTFSSGGTSVSASGVAMLNFDLQKAFSLSATQASAAFGSFDELDAGAVDTGLKVGIVVEEHSNKFALLDLRGLGNPASYTFDTATSTVTALSPATQLKLVTLTGLPNVSGVNVNSAAHLAFIIEETGDHLAVASIDDPAHPAAAAGWAGFNDFRFESNASLVTGSPTQFCGPGDPHAEATIAHFSNGRTYGFALNVCDRRSSQSSGALIVDLKNFIAAPATAAAGSHQLLTNPYADATIIQTVVF